MMMKMCFVASLAIILTCASCAGRNAKPILVIGHRGSPKLAPENTLASFRAAIDADADYVELDTRASADGTLYCLHDDTLDRTSNAVESLGREKILIAQLTDAQIDALDAGSWFGTSYAGERIPRLSDALDLIQAHTQTLLERKAGSAASHARMLREKNLIGKLILQSFDWPFLEELHKLEPTQPLAVLGDKAFDDERWAALPATGAKVVAWKHTDLDADLIARLHAQGYRVFAWTVDELPDWQRLAAAGIDGIITNRPGELRHAMQDGKLGQGAAAAN